MFTRWRFWSEKWTWVVVDNMEGEYLYYHNSFCLKNALLFIPVCRTKPRPWRTLMNGSRLFRNAACRLFLWSTAENPPRNFSPLKLCVSLTQRRYVLRFSFSYEYIKYSVCIVYSRNNMTKFNTTCQRVWFFLECADSERCPLNVETLQLPGELVPLECTHWAHVDVSSMKWPTLLSRWYLIYSVNSLF